MYCAKARPPPTNGQQRNEQSMYIQDSAFLSLKNEQRKTIYELSLLNADDI
jgi:hypothetical protein